MDNSFDSEALSQDFESIETDEETKNNKKEEKVNEINEDLIKAISLAINIILQKNKELPNYKNIIINQKKNIFSSEKIPKISVLDYLKRIQKYSGMEKSSLIITLILLDRICEIAELSLTYYNVHRLLFTAVLTAIKYNEDDYYENKYYSEIGGIPLNELRLFEYNFLVLINFNSFISNELFDEYCKFLENFIKETKIE